ncbi:hypothetical protein [Paeniglutamicibacter sulfureus]|uniref:Uncharacterized protein n=1 Tax=Paeniglutamicibacter sulfureus TaxID=43666 RepID=A0ABU2BLH5_9MICC|nr:hypothetical protein [Paeniglutamicibacter sulfureus]MDO2935187.1 hypothetical protein [Paeniglutamicibacter sulfureus]MDR7359500.1 hypothetical protein [Paeniglutamicibacter sulfureus]
MLVCSTQTKSAQTEHIRKQAGASTVPVIDFTVTLPPNTDFVSWMESNIRVLEVLAWVARLPRHRLQTRQPSLDLCQPSWHKSSEGVHERRCTGMEYAPMRTRGGPWMDRFLASSATSNPSP